MTDIFRWCRHFDAAVKDLTERHEAHKAHLRMVGAQIDAAIASEKGSVQ